MAKLEYGAVTELKSNRALSIPSILKSIGISFGFTLVVFFIFALLITYTNFPESAIGTVVLLTTVLSILLAGMVISRRATTKGWLNGAVAGLIYTAILYVIGALSVTGLVFDKQVIIMALIGFFAGAFGGIIGINMRKK